MSIAKPAQDEPKGYRNYGDHPYVVGIGVIASIIAIIVGGVTLVEHLEKRPKPIPNLPLLNKGFFVIGFGDHDKNRAMAESSRQKANGFENQVTYSSEWTGLNSGWYIVVYDSFEERSEAETTKAWLERKSIHTYVKYSGDRIAPVKSE